MSLFQPSQTAIIVAPNGARKTREDHPNIPIAQQSIIDEVIACRDAGAAMVHLHARKRTGQHSLEIEDNLPLYEALKDKVSDSILVQLTTEAVGQYSPAQQQALIRAVKPEAASFALRELIPDESDTASASRFFHWVAEQGILSQYILYDNHDLRRYLQWLSQGVLPNYHHHLLLVLGRYSNGQVAYPSDLITILGSRLFELDHRWAVCAFGQFEHKCLTAAMLMGADVRVGFENNHYDNQGAIAPNNATLVSQLVETASALNIKRMTAERLKYHLTSTGS